MKKVIVLAILIEFCRPDPAGKLLIVSFDGFGGGFLSRVDTPNIYELIKKSAYKERILNVFPTQTFPNHFSIATGLYAEEHGVLGSTVMDGGQILHYGYKMFHYNDNIIPIWTLNEMAVGSRHSGCCMWPGCDLQYNGVGTTYNIPFNLSTPWPDRIETSLSWFTNQAKPANLVMMYFESPDFEEHIYGPNSNQTKDKIRKADEYVGRILAGLKSRGLNDVNVVVLSDHGMEGVPMSHLINVTDILNQRGRSVGTTPVLQIFPDAGKHDDLYSRLIALSKNTSHFDVYLKEEIPYRYRIKNCTRAPPILAVARPGYALLDEEYSKWLKDVTSKHKRVLSSSSELGFHGYDPELQSMQPFLIAYGPQFPKDFVLPNRTVGLYKVFKGVLRIDSFKRIPKSTFVGSSSLEPGRLTTFHQISFIIGGPLIGLIAVVIMFALFRKRYSARNMGYTLVEKEESGV